MGKVNSKTAFRLCRKVNSKTNITLFRKVNSKTKFTLCEKLNSKLNHTIVTTPQNSYANKNCYLGFIIGYNIAHKKKIWKSLQSSLF